MNTTPPDHAVPFRQAQGPELAEGERTATRCMTRLKEELKIMNQAMLALDGRRSSC
jgi:hypothetical protein